MMTRSRSNPKKTEGKGDKEVAQPKASSRPAKKQKKEAQPKDDKKVEKQSAKAKVEKKTESNGIKESSSSSTSSSGQSIFDFTVKDIDGKDVCLDKYKGYVTLVVNVASRCGYTKKSYDQLNELYGKLYDEGLRIAAFPCNQFGGQEPGSCDKIKESVQKRGVKFDLYEKIAVNGANEHPLYKYLKTATGDPDAPIKWNFNKFLVNKKGVPVKRYLSKHYPLDLLPDIEEELAK